MKTNLFLTTALAAVVLCACSSEETISNTNNHSTVRGEHPDLSSLQNTALSNLIQTFTFDSRTENVRFETASGVQINIKGGRFTVNGTPVSGTLTLKYAEIFSRGNMITANKTTMGLTSPASETDQELEVLKSGGEFYAQITTEQGESVDGASYSLTVPVQLTGEPDEQMTGWKGEPTEDGDIIWDEDSDDDGTPDTEVTIEDNKYIINIDNLGWTNIDILRSYPGPKTTLAIDVPAGYNLSNCSVYLAYTGLMSGIAKLDAEDPVTGNITEHYGQVPIGMTGNVIFVSESGGQWLYAVKPVTFVANGIETITTADLSTATEASLIATLNSLP